MNKKIKVAKELIKLAKSLIAYQEDNTVHEQIMQEDKVSNIDKLIKENYPNKYEDVTEDEWMHIFDICQGFAYDQVIKGQSMNTHDVNDVMNIFRSKIWNKIENKDFKTYKGEDITNLQSYLFGAIKFIAKKYKEAFYLHRKDKRDISIEENELQNYINNNSFEEPEKIEQENQYNEAINVMLEEVEKLKDYKINDFKKHAPIQNEDFSFFDLLKKYFDEKIPMETIAKEIGITYSGVQQLFKHIFPYLKNKLQQKGIKNLNNIDIIKTSSDFIEDMLSDENFWQMIK